MRFPRRLAVAAAALLLFAHVAFKGRTPAAGAPPAPSRLAKPQPSRPPRAARQKAADEALVNCPPGSAVSFKNLELNAAGRELWRCLGIPGGPRTVMLTFGSKSMSEFMLNWVEHVRRLGQKLYLVGALDAQLTAVCEAHGVPSATITRAALEAMQLGSHVSQLGSSAGAYYRYAPGTFLRMGLVKQVFIVQMLAAGLDAMVSDVDVVWLASPWPLVRYGDAAEAARDGAVPPHARLLALADVVLSVDQVQQYMDSDKYRWHVDSELNTGVAFFRNSVGARAVLDEWAAQMKAAIAKGDPNHDQYWLNGVLRPRDFFNLKTDAAARASWLPAALQTAHAAANLPVGLPSTARAFEASLSTISPFLRAIYLFKRRFGANGSGVALGTFPIAQVSNGHTFFVQQLHHIVGVRPIAVHTTYQYGDATTYAYGKRQRLRDEQLWLMDGPQYYNGTYLQLLTAPARLLSPDHAELLLPELNGTEHCVLSHLRLSALQRQWIQDAFLLAAATRRTLILPRIWCVADRFWTILNRCLIGSRVEMPQPFVCPLDHSFDLPAMHAANLQWREHSFLSHPKADPSLAASQLRLRVGEARHPSTEAELRLPAGSDFAAVARAVRASPLAAEARVLTVDADDLRSLCRCVGGLPELLELNARLPSALRSSYDFCDTTDNPYFVECKGAGRSGCRKHPTYTMNISQGIQTVRALPTEGCGQGVGGCQAYELPDRHITRKRWRG
ncbi:hypothetical protein AB1Y20_018522 [Prymnesium parvum]|uniref:Nucleotide-diphospho-sugar transferase domain-containing protein n=1 Tax=Prymnesium parvum TaxID=97485 RepID=A0AB34JQ52_PRYPA